MTNVTIVVLCMGGVGHLQTLLPVVAGLAAHGSTVHVLTRGEFRSAVERVGARFADLFAGRPLEAADATSIPIPSRFVTFAGTYAERLADEIAALSPALILYETFAVAAPVVARQLGLPWVNVCPNHAPVPERMLADLRADPRVAISDECRAAVQRLRDVHGISGASPFSYYDNLSPFLNLYAEPAEFLPKSDRSAFEPLAFFGSLLPPPGDDRAIAGFPREQRGKRVYVSFGTGVWRYFERPAIAALTSLSRALAGRDVDVLVSLGNHAIAPDVRAEIARPNVRVADYVDQWAALAQADLFVTHHGINSTHESIFCQVPMLSYPFFGDQPALARRCQKLGLAVPLASEPRAPLEPEAVLAALARLDAESESFATRLAEARSWELRTIAGRSAILDRIFELAKPQSVGR
jgi:MGT family glycosyltransferase